MSEALRKAAEQALAVLAKTKCDALYGRDCTICNAEAALRAALAEPEQSEPVYQMRTSHGTWIDQTKDQYLYNKGYDRSREIRILYTAAPPRREPTWIKTSEQYPPEGVRVCWCEPRTNQVGYDTWMGGDYRFNAEYWMHIPGIGGKE